MGQEKHIWLLIICGNVCCVISLVLFAASMGTERWLVFTVDRTKFTPVQLASTSTGVEALYSHTRQRGMFRECYPGSEPAFLGSHQGVVDKNCFMLMFSDEDPGTTTNYRSKVGLHTGFMCAFVLSEVLLIVIYFLGFCLCIKYIVSPIWVAALLAFFSTFFAVVGIAFFHFSWYIEENVARNTVNGRQMLYSQWPQYLKNATTITLSESYRAAWVGVFFAILTTAFFTMASCLSVSKRHKTKSHHHRRHMHDIPVVVQGRPPQVVQQQPVIYTDHLARTKQPIIVPTDVYTEAKNAASVVYDNRLPEVYTTHANTNGLKVYSKTQEDDRVVFREHGKERKHRRHRHRSSKHRQEHDQEPEHRESSGGVPVNELDLLRRSDKRPTSFRSVTADPLFLY